ncbi:MAG: branched-chain amino acid aminotransferase [Saprospiraceae bacterium]|jgi:branched-chain amino acid aminotransferase
MNEFDNVNGFLIEKGEKLFNTGNRSFKYGDGIFETMKVVDSKVLFLDDHLQRLQLGMRLLKIDNDSFDAKKWGREIERVILKNRYTFAKLRMTIYRESPGLYTPMANDMGFIIEGVSYDRKNYTFKSEGISLGVFDELHKPVDKIANCKTTSALVYVMASLYKKEQQLGDVVVLNSKGAVCESSNANLFYVKDDQVFTPSLDQGCIAGVFRMQVINYCEKKNVVLEELKVSIQDLLDADEIFLTNVIGGVQGVSDFQNVGKSQDFVKQLQSFFN